MEFQKFDLINCRKLPRVREKLLPATKTRRPSYSVSHDGFHAFRLLRTMPTLDAILATELVSASGTTSATSGNRTAELENYRKAVAIDEELVKGDGNNADFRRQNGLTYLRFSTFMSDGGDMAGALSSAQQAKTLDEVLVAAAPANVVARSNLALIYSQPGKVHVAIAAKTASGESQQITHWREAKVWYQKSLTIWQNMKERGTLNGADAAKPDKVSREIAKCDAALAASP